MSDLNRIQPGASSHTRSAASRGTTTWNNGAGPRLSMTSLLSSSPAA